MGEGSPAAQEDIGQAPALGQTEEAAVRSPPADGAGDGGAGQGGESPGLLLRAVNEKLKVLEDAVAKLKDAVAGLASSILEGQKNSSKKGVSSVHLEQLSLNTVGNNNSIHVVINGSSLGNTTQGDSGSRPVADKSYITGGAAGDLREAELKIDGLAAKSAQQERLIAHLERFNALVLEENEELRRLLANAAVEA